MPEHQGCTTQECLVGKPYECPYAVFVMVAWVKDLRVGDRQVIHAHGPDPLRLFTEVAVSNADVVHVVWRGLNGWPDGEGEWRPHERISILPVLKTRVAEMQRGDVQVFDDNEHAHHELRLILGVKLADARERYELNDGRMRYHEDVDLYVVTTQILDGIIGSGISVGLWPGDDPVYVRREYRITEEPELFTCDAPRASCVTRLRDVLCALRDSPRNQPEVFS